MGPDKTFAIFFSMVRLLMREKGVSIAELSRRSGVSRERLHLYFKGTGAYPHLSNLVNIANALGYGVRFILKAQEGKQRQTDEELLHAINVTAEESYRDSPFTFSKRQANRTKVSIEENTGRGVFPLKASGKDIGALALDLPVNEDSLKTALTQLLQKLE
jgi:transcriptional regulator with XRE-family HTH domain